MFALKRKITALAVALTPLVAACSDSLSPDAVDPQALESRMNAITGAFDNASFQSAAQLSGLFPQYAAVAAFRTGMLADTRLKGRSLMAQSRARMEAARVYASLRAAPQALFP